MNRYEEEDGCYLIPKKEFFYGDLPVSNSDYCQLGSMRVQFLKVPIEVWDNREKYCFGTNIKGDVFYNLR